ncbi:transposase family protein [Escherichia coli 174900]|nr:transposase family protein [Escherichia coli 174900]
MRFLFASKPEAIGPVLGIVQRVIAGWLADQAGIDRASAQCGAVTLIQRFGSALNLNIHFHMLWLDGVYGKPPSCRGANCACTAPVRPPPRS